MSLAYLWQRDQKLLLEEMLQAGVSTVIIKVACLGLKPAKHLGRSLEEVYPYLCELVCVSHRLILYICLRSVEIERHRQRLGSPGFLTFYFYPGLDGTPLPPPPA